MTLLFALLTLAQAAQTVPADVTAPTAPQPAQVQMAAANTSAAPKPAPRTVCTRESIPGSNRVQRVCRTEEQADAARENARLFVERHMGPQVEDVVNPGENGSVGGGHNE